MADKCKRTRIEFDHAFPKVQVSSTIDAKGEPILEGAKGMSDIIICENLIGTIILRVDYVNAINMSKEDNQTKLNQDCSYV